MHASENGSSTRLTMPAFRVWVCGTFRVERLVGQVYEPIRVPEWGGSNYPRLLLKVLLCCPRRQARRDVLSEMLWSQCDPEQAIQNLNTATTKLRGVLRLTKEHESLLVTEDSVSYELAEQSLLWVDADASLALLKEAEHIGRTTLQAFPLLAKAVEYLSRGTFLADEEGLWLYGRRGDLNEACYNGRLWLADAYAKQGMIGQAELQWRGLLDEDPTDEDVLRRAMVFLHEYGMTHKALRLYRQVAKRGAQDGFQLTNATSMLEERLRVQQNVLLPEIQTQETSRDAPGTVRSFSQREGLLDESIETYPHLWSVPHQRNPFFTGREEVLTRLHTLLHEEWDGVAVAPYALCGLGGVGKTQTVLEYAYRFSNEYQIVAWIKADTREHIIADWLALATLLNLPEQAAQDQEVMLASVKRWLSEHTHWLLIFDNADDLTLVQAFLPERSQGHILLTTRAQATGRIAHRVGVEEMDLDIGALFLLRRTGMIGAHASLEDATQRGHILAQKIVQMLGGLPLALDQAGAYIEETSLSLQEYIQLYQKQHTSLLKRRGGLVSDHPEPVATTWSLSFARVEQMDSMAADILHLCAFLDPGAIPEDILFVGLQQLAASSSDLHQIRFNEAIGSLLRFSLVRRNGDTHTITVHQLIQSVICDNLLPEQQSEWIHRVVHLLSEIFPSAVEVTTWPLCEKFLPHALLCAHWIERAHIPSMKAASLLNAIGYYLNMRARYELALPLFQRALRMREQVLGEVHPDTAQTLSDLAYLYHHQDQFEEAMHFLQRSLFIRQQVLGMEHPDTATSLNALALLYRDQGRYEEAEAFFQQALAIRKQIFGTEHPQTAHSLSNLAWLYRNLRKYHEAEQLYDQSLTMRKRILGVDHPDTATSLNGLALLYAAQKKYAKAEPLFQQAVAIRRQVLGTKHLHTTQSMNALALLYRDQGEYEKAERLFLEVAAIREQLFGSHHPRTATSLHNLAFLYYKQGKFEQAETLFLRALALREQIFGREDPRTLAILSNLTRCQDAMEQCKK